MNVSKTCLRMGSQHTALQGIPLKDLHSMRGFRVAKRVADIDNLRKPELVQTKQKLHAILSATPIPTLKQSKSPVPQV